MHRYDEAGFCYKVNDFCHPNNKGGVAWNDPTIGIKRTDVQGEYQDGIGKDRRNIWERECIWQ